MSIKPGAIVNPEPSITLPSSAPFKIEPTWLITPLVTSKSWRLAGESLPSITSAPRIVNVFSAIKFNLSLQPFYTLEQDQQEVHHLLQTHYR